MDAKKIFQPKIWYIICGAMALIGGIENNINAESWAESAWGVDGVNDQSLAMEALFGLFMAGFGAMALTSAFVLSGTSQAKFAMVNGGVMMAFFLAMFVVLGDTGYELPGVAWLIPPFLLLGGLTTAGYLHKDGE
ncbi:MAG: hypothetical protein VXA63_04550 [Euryarchaeota archaeon]|nr:hypothetical protein [Candidatus Thermoplasmatota archaeon]|tara:strand:+ start:285 stop:689 length:405 start_codon:yes stop_codon:yes gene_type:complete